MTGTFYCGNDILDCLATEIWGKGDNNLYSYGWLRGEDIKLKTRVIGHSVLNSLLPVPDAEHLGIIKIKALSLDPKDVKISEDN